MTLTSEFLSAFDHNCHLWSMDMNIPTWYCHLVRCKDIPKLEIPESVYFLGKCPTKRLKCLCISDLLRVGMKMLMSGCS